MIDLTKTKECEHNFEHLYHPGRATWICKMCGDDVSLIYVLMQQALNPELYEQNN